MKPRSLLFWLVTLIAFLEAIHIVMLHWEIGLYKEMIEELRPREKIQMKGGLVVVDFRLLNGKPKCTLIESMDGRTKIIWRKSTGGLVEKGDLRREDALAFCEKHGLEINVSHLAAFERPKE